MWLPISEAPRDGSPILAWDGDVMTTVESSGTIYGPEWVLCVAGSYAEYDGFEPTHWMPLPDAPVKPSE
jgi:hypothetical protein